MIRSHGAASSWVGVTSIRSILGSMFVVLSLLVLGAPSANALPPATGSKCGSGWVNNGGAMQCFIQGEDDVNNGVSHPHYVACTSAGEIFCCVDDNNGHQNCEAQASKQITTQAQRIRGILAAQRAMSRTVERSPDKTDNPAGTAPGPNRKSTP